MPFGIDQKKADKLTHAIQDAIAAGDDDHAYDLTQRPAFVFLCSQLSISPDVALIRLREQRSLTDHPAAL